MDCLAILLKIFVARLDRRSKTGDMEKAPRVLSPENQIWHGAVIEKELILVMKRNIRHSSLSMALLHPGRSKYMKLKLFTFGIAVMAATCVHAQQVQGIAGLYNTGVDDNNALLPLGSVDPHYTLITSADTNAPGPNAYVGIVPGFWINNGPNSEWIAAVPTTGAGNCITGGDCVAGGNYVYRTTFDLSGYDPATVSIAGTWSMDNVGVDIILNGGSTGITDSTIGFWGWSSFALTNGFVNGPNTLDFVVWNQAGPG